ncbi:MAG: response regulator [Myxococcota bacterium]
MRNLRVVVVDDNEEQLRMVSRLLRMEGFEVETSMTPFGVSNLVRTFVPDAVLIDLHMPALSGDKILELLRKNFSIRLPKLFLYSSADEADLKRLAEENGADGWIVKGTPPGVVAARIRDACIPSVSDR